MTPAELANATWWASLWGDIEQWAFLAVVVFLAIEFVALKMGAPYKEKLEAAKDLKIAELQQIAPRILSVPTQDAIRETLSPLGPFIVHIGTTTSLLHTFDIDSFASQIAGVLALAGWNASVMTWYHEDREDRPAGVWVRTREGDGKAASAADALVAELNKAGIVAHKDDRLLSVKPPRPPSGGGMTSQVAMLHWTLLPDIEIVVGTKR